MSVGDMFDVPGHSVKECKACQYEQHDDGTVMGNKNCLDNVAAIPDAVHSCPNYAQAACFTGHAVHVDYGKNIEQVRFNTF